MAISCGFVQLPLSSSSCHKHNCNLNFVFLPSSSTPLLHAASKLKFQFRIPYSYGSGRRGPSRMGNSPRSSAALLVSEEGSYPTPTNTSENEKQKFDDGLALPNMDRSGRFCSPRAGRELALLTIYAACLQGSDPVRLFDKRLNAPREPGFEFDQNCLLGYNLMSFAGPPLATQTLEEASQIISQFESESATEAQVLSAPPKLVYSKLLLRFARKLLVAVVDQWDSHVLSIDKVAPANWKNQPISRILELSILHLAMSEISVLGTRHPIVVNEAVDLAKRYCDGSAPRIINGCLRTFIKDHGEPSTILRSREATV